MASSSSSHQQTQESNALSNAFSGIEPTGKRRKVSESSRLFDVFINHRGPDVKQTFATEFYNSLGQKGIHAFLDSQEKELGDSFTSTIKTAIRSAKVHIAIFSKGYAESPWCLAELVLMIESKAKIIPVFYEVEPWELRHIEKGVYAAAFMKYEENNRYLEKLNEWKEALQTLSFIAGEVFHGDCETIVAAVEKEVQRKQCLHVAKYPVGLDNLVKDFERRCLDELVQDFENHCCLEERKDKPNIAGIFGMGGVGKTTLAKELFNRKGSNYSRASFLFDVREASVRSELPRLQSQLVKDLFAKDPKDRDLSFRTIEEGKSYLNDHLQRSHSLDFLIVVDDIDHVEQLDALLVMDILNKADRSLVIVTTRDVGIVISAGITVGYSLKGMDGSHGKQLFCWHAFNRDLPSIGYEALVDQFVDVCRGLPLSLLVLGRLVHGRPQSYWELQLNKAKETLHRDVKQRLRISFDALDDEEKQIFLDIACFFVGRPKRMAEIICEASGWNVKNALQTLKDKCLLDEEYIDQEDIDQEDIVLRMHDHLRDLGREIALELSSPRRLWRARDLKTLESMDLQTMLAKTNIRCFHSIFDNSMDCKVTLFLGQSDNCFETSASLLWLKLDYWYGETEPQSFPSWIPLQHLQCLEICEGRFKKLWENHIEIFSCQHQLSTSRRDLQRVSGSNYPIKLRDLLIYHCPALEELPDLSTLNCIENIEIRYCDKLQNISLPTTFIRLYVTDCRDLKRVVGYGTDLMKVTELIISECPELEELPSFSRLSCTEKIQIDNCENLQNIMLLPTTIISLCLRSCRDLKRVVGYGDLIKLTKLIISECPQLEELPSLSSLNDMEKIAIASAKKLEKISGIEELDSLESMQLGYWSNAAILNCIQNLKSAPRKLYMIGKAVDGAESSFNENLFSDALINADALTEIITHNSVENNGAVNRADSSFNEYLFYGGHIDACQLTEILTHNSGAVDGAESSFNKHLLCDAHIGADAVPQIVTRNSGENSCAVDIKQWWKKRDVTSAAVIGCFLAVADSSNSAKDINDCLQLYKERCVSRDPYPYEDNSWTWPKVREGEQIITIVASDDLKDDVDYNYAEYVLVWKGLMKKGFRVEVKKGEEWKCLSMLKTITDRLHQRGA